jgi:hypothetical protein
MRCAFIVTVTLMHASAVLERSVLLLWKSYQDWGCALLLVLICGGVLLALAFVRRNFQTGDR